MSSPCGGEITFRWGLGGFVFTRSWIGGIQKNDTALVFKDTLNIKPNLSNVDNSM